MIDKCCQLSSSEENRRNRHKIVDNSLRPPNNTQIKTKQQQSCDNIEGSVGEENDGQPTWRMAGLCIHYRLQRSMTRHLAVLTSIYAQRRFS